MAVIRLMRPDDPLASLPPEARARAMDAPLPRNRRPLVIGLLVTVALHVTVIWYLFSASLKIDAQEMLVFFSMVAPKDAGALPAHHAAPAPASTPDRR